MAWTSPMTFVANSVLTAAQLNTHLRDNLNETAAAKATTAGRIFVSTGANSLAERVPTANNVDTSEATASTTYTDLTTTGPAVTATSGVRAIVMISAAIAQTTVAGYGYMGYDISGASTVAAASPRSVSMRAAAANQQITAGIVVMETSLTAGSNTYTAKYTASSGGGSATFASRRLSVVPL